MKGITPEMMEKAKNAKNAEELLALAKENGVAMSEDEAQMYYDQLNPKSGELSDDDLDAVAGGGCQSSSGRTVVTSGCSCFTGEYQPIYNDRYCTEWVDGDDVVRRDNIILRHEWYKFSGKETCGRCRFLEFEGGMGVCGKS